MKCKVRLTHTVEMYVEGESEEAIQDWLSQTTPGEAKSLSKNATEAYSEEIVCPVREDSHVDFVIGKGLLSAGIIKQDEITPKAEPTELYENNMDFSLVFVDFPTYSPAELSEEITKAYVDIPCRIYLNKAPNEEYRAIAKRLDGENYKEKGFFIETLIGRDGAEEPWQASNWFLFYADRNGRFEKLADGIELLDAFKFVKAGYEEMMAMALQKNITETTPLVKKRGR